MGHARNVVRLTTSFAAKRYSPLFVTMFERKLRKSRLHCFMARGWNSSHGPGPVTEAMKILLKNDGHFTVTIRII